jgi:hypothetical protein
METATGYPQTLNFLVGQVQDAKNLVLRFHYSKRFAAYEANPSPLNRDELSWWAHVLSIKVQEWALAERVKDGTT